MSASSISFSKKWSIIRKTLSRQPGPKFASLFVTRKCNLACQYCQSFRNRGEDIDLATWKRIIDRLHSWGVRVFSMTGGEPLLRPDIMEIVHYISRENKAVSWLISNFKVMEKPLIDRLANAGLDFLTASLDSLQAGNKGTGEHLLTKLDYARSRDIICSTLTVVQPGNLDEIKKIVEEVTKRGFIFDMGLCHNVGGLFSNKDDNIIISNRCQLEDLRRFLIRKKLLTGLIAPSWGYLTRGWKHYPEMSWKCSSKKDKFLVVNNDGRLMACQEWTSGIPVLSINSLNNEKWRREKSPLVENCRGCAYGCYFQKEITGPMDLLLGLYSLLRT